MYLLKIIVFSLLYFTSILGFAVTDGTPALICPMAFSPKFSVAKTTLSKKAVAHLASKNIHTLEQVKDTNLDDLFKHTPALNSTDKGELVDFIQKVKDGAFWHNANVIMPDYILVEDLGFSSNTMFILSKNNIFTLKELADFIQSYDFNTLKKMIPGELTFITETLQAIEQYGEFNLINRRSENPAATKKATRH